ncbi:MAG: hypothetical protein N2037_01465 [Acidimicrobiales bacterium]|nr:hypothetical protein [Acidimicrobiales bacterium]
MSDHTPPAATATLIAIAFAFSTLERYLRARKRHELMWTLSLFMFAAGSLGLWMGAAFGWGEFNFKVFYLFGAILNVPFLALGTVHLLTRNQRRSDVIAASVALLSAFATGIVVASPVIGTIDPRTLPRGSEVFGLGPRILAAVASGLASVVIIGGAVWSALRLVLSHRKPGHATLLSPGRLALANVLIAIGTLILGAGGLSNSVLDAMDTFAVSLVVGIAVIFGGFLLTNTAPPVKPWYPSIVREDRAA